MSDAFAKSPCTVTNRSWAMRGGRTGRDIRLQIGELGSVTIGQLGCDLGEVTFSGVGVEGWRGGAPICSAMKSGAWTQLRS